MTANIRKSNIELLRIVSMIFVVLLHCNYFSLGDSTTFDTHSITGYIRILCEQICIVGVNVFVLISGWFGIKFRITGIASLLFQVFFFSSLITLSFVVFGKPISFGGYLISLTGHRYWFVSSYMMLYIISPMLNKFVEASTKRELFTVIVTFFIFEILFGWVIRKYEGSGEFQDGYSVISFIGLYLLARTCNTFSLKVTSFPSVCYLLLYLLFTIIPSILVVFGGDGNIQISYISPFVIISSFSLFLFFTKLEIQSKIINWISCSVLSVYLIHLHPLIIPYFKQFVVMLYAKYHYLYIFACVIFIVLLFVLCIMLDKIRIVLWRIFLPRIKRLNRICFCSTKKKSLV